MWYYEPLYSCINPSDAPLVCENRIRAEVKYVEEYSLPFPAPHTRAQKARALASIGGYFPPYLIREYSQFDYWSRYMGLTLIAGFRPEVLAGVGLMQLMQLQGESVLYERLAASIPLKNSIPYESLCRLDGVYGVDLTGKYETPNIHRVKIDSDDGIKLCRGLLFYLRYARDQIMPCWFASDLANEERLPPSEFVRWALNHDIRIPWLAFAKRHYPYLLPEELTGGSILATEDRVSEVEDQRNQPPEPEAENQRGQGTSIEKTGGPVRPETVDKHTALCMVARKMLKDDPDLKERPLAGKLKKETQVGKGYSEERIRQIIRPVMQKFKEKQKNQS